MEAGHTGIRQPPLLKVCSVVVRISHTAVTQSDPRPFLFLLSLPTHYPHLMIFLKHTQNGIKKTVAFSASSQLSLIINGNPLESTNHSWHSCTSKHRIHWFSLLKILKDHPLPALYIPDSLYGTQSFMD